MKINVKIGNTIKEIESNNYLKDSCLMITQEQS